MQRYGSKAARRRDKTKQAVILNHPWGAHDLCPPDGYTVPAGVVVTQH